MGDFSVIQNSESDEDLLEIDEHGIVRLAPLEKQDEVSQRLSALAIRAKSEDWGHGGLIEAVENTENTVRFFNSVYEEVSSKIKTSNFEKENTQSLLDIFVDNIDLRTDSVLEINNKKKEFLENISILVETKEQISEITSKESLDLNKWVKLLRIEPAKFRQELKNWWNQKQQSLKEELSKIGDQRESLRFIVQQGLFPDKEKDDLLEKISDMDSAEGLLKEEKKLKALNKKRQKIAEKRYKTAVLDELDNPLHAKKILRNLREKFGWGVLNFLGAEKLNEKLDEINDLQARRVNKITYLSKLGKDRSELDFQIARAREEIARLDHEIGDLTGKVPDAEPVNNIIQFTDQSDEVAECDEDAPESIQTKINALNDVLKAISVWRQHAKNCFEKGSDVQEGKLARMQKDPEEYAWRGGFARYDFLKNHEDGAGENLWNKYRQLNERCAYTVPRDLQTHLPEGEWHSRPVPIPLDDLTVGAAEGLSARINMYLSSNPELLFLAGEFLLNPQKDKNLKPSPPAEVESLVKFKMAELSAKLQNQKLKKAA